MSAARTGDHDNPRPLPLEGVRVLDFTQVELGPSGTQVLGDFGAEVIKIERPGSGDLSRAVDNFALGDPEASAYYLSLNRNKRSVALNFTVPEGNHLIKRLVATCDVLVENFRPGVLARHGLSYESLREDHPGLIYVSGTGFGLSGPLVGHGGQDTLAQSMSGVAMHNRDETGRPQLYPVSFADFSGGMLIAQGVLLALLERQMSGKGQHVHVSLLGALLAAQMQEYTQWFMRNEETNFLKQHPVRVIRTADGWVTIAGFFKDRIEERIRDAFGIAEPADSADRAPADATGDPLETKRRAYAQLFAAVEEVSVTMTSEECIACLSEQDVLCAVVLDYATVPLHEQVVENGFFVDIERSTGRFRTVRSPVEMSAVAEPPLHAPPLLGEHTHAVLAELGLDDDEIDALSELGVIEFAGAPRAARDDGGGSDGAGATSATARA